MEESFLRYIRYEKNLSSHTVLSYKNDLLQFESFIKDQTEGIKPEDADPDMIRNWIAGLMEAGMTARSVARKVSSLRAFFRYLVKEGRISGNPAIGLSLPKIRKKLPVFVRTAEMDKLLDEIPFEADFRGKRDRLIIDMLYSTGMRRAELIGLKDGDIDWEQGVLKVTGKRNKQRLIPFGQELKELLLDYYNERNRSVAGPYAAFLVRENGEALYPGLVYRTVTRYLEEVCTLTKRSPHVLRHTFASAMLNHGAELNSVKELLGHSSLASTEVYTHITVEELKKNYKQAHPRAE